MCPGDWDSVYNTSIFPVGAGCGLGVAYDRSKTYGLLYLGHQRSVSAVVSAVVTSVGVRERILRCCYGFAKIQCECTHTHSFELKHQFERAL